MLSKISKLKKLSGLFSAKQLRLFSDSSKAANEVQKALYQSPSVESRFYKKPVPKFSVGEILRIEHICKDYENYYDTEGIIAGWARTVRTAAGNTIVFIELNDGSDLKSLQIVVDKSMPNFEELCKTGVGASFRIKGKFVKSPAKGQPIEVLVNDPEAHYVKVVGSISDPKTYPLSKKGHTLEVLREVAHLRPRSRYLSAMTRTRNSLGIATHLFFQNLGFLYIQTPIITSSDCEGAGEMFSVTTLLPQPNESIKQIKTVPNKDNIDYNRDFFKKPTFLTVSGQLSLESYACSMSNVYNFGPTFRAEKSHTSRHLAEFWMIEPEIAFADLEDNMNVAEEYVKFCVQYILENNMADLEYFQAEQIRRAKEEKKPQPKIKLLENLTNVVESKFKRITYEEAINICIKAEEEGKVTFEKKLSWGVDMSSEHERFLAEQIYFSPVIIYNHPKEFKAFYMRLNQDNKTVSSMDLIVPGVGELIGGSQREERLDILDKRLEEMKLDKEIYWWYRDLRKYGSVPHSGFGLGFERLVMFCTGIENIRDSIPFPRVPGHADF